MVRPEAIFTFPRDVEAVPRIRRFVSRWLDDVHICEPARSDVLLALDEAASNASLHTPPGNRATHVTCSKKGSVLTVAVADHGDGFEFDGSCDEPAWERTDGRGLFLMSSLMDQVRVDRTVEGTRVVLIRDLADESDQT